MQIWDIAPIESTSSSSDSSDDSLAQLLSAVTFASVKHSEQRRKDIDGTPYINHVIGVAQLLASNGHTSVHTLQAAILHDTVEDTATTLDELRDVFGERVASIVHECTDDKSLPKQARKQAQIDKAGCVSIEAQQVKLADKLYNLRDLQRCPPPDWTVHRIKEYYTWARNVTCQMRQASEPLSRLLDDVYANGTFEKDGVKYKCLD
ncbi:hypothetical protein E3P99_00375 [Wallemia hederae]|uniref:Guanosine-3',5'-bis(diphosphate) 3'-pyrophosphohydrolase MESH1 n=1 Tax=Wallemia hederae TaxID=1540922 RepID=A0A4T0FVQ5_9BASI|nr:hypothetical protein E3P99_00375 [Wallemia hederae]